MITQIRSEDGDIVTDERGIRRVFVNYLKALYCPIEATQSTNIDEFFDLKIDQSYPTIEASAHAALTRPPQEEEIREILFRMGPDKAPGPDGITACLLQSHWEIFKHDITRIMQDSFNTAQPPA